jgi:TonB family protein
VITSPGYKPTDSQGNDLDHSTLFMQPNDSMKQEYYKAYPFYAKMEKGDAWSYVEEDTEFPGGISAMRQYLAAEIYYPRDAVDLSIQGKVYISFIVEADGRITSVHVLRGVCLSMDKESVRVIEKMPRWKPGKIDGKAVRCVFHIPISYTLH